MHYYTKMKIRDTRTFLKANFEEYAKNYEGVVGMHIAKRIRGGKEVNRYCLVVRVIQKKDEDLLKNVLPKSIQIKSSIKKVLYHNIPIDVVETGKIEFNSVLSETDFGRYIYPGSVSMIIIIEHRVYMICCMHVFGGEYVDDNFGQSFEFDDPFNDFQNIYIDDYAVGTLKRGSFIPEDGVDIAMAELQPDYFLDDQDVFLLSSYDDIADFQYLEESSFNKYEVVTDGSINRGRTFVVDPEVPAILTFNEQLVIKFHDVIQLNGRLSETGDSGGLVYDSFNKFYGLILGSDRKYTYAVNLNSAIEYL